MRQRLLSDSDEHITCTLFNDWLHEQGKFLAINVFEVNDVSMIVEDY